MDQGPSKSTNFNILYNAFFWGERIVVPGKKQSYIRVSIRVDQMSANSRYPFGRFGNLKP